MTDREIETLYWGTAQLFSPMANHAAVIVKFARMIEQAAIKQAREAIIDIDAFLGGSVEIEAHIRARSVEGS